VTKRCATLAVLACALAACERQAPAAQLGQTLFADPRVSTSPFNDYACKTCHQVGGLGRDVADAPIDPGHDLQNVVHRGAWWGGYVTRLSDALNECITEFMGGAPLAEDSDEARQLFEYLAKQSPDAQAKPLPMTIVRNIRPLSDLEGDIERGRVLYGQTCRRCHGDPHSGSGRLNDRVSVIPDDTLRTFPYETRAATVEKVRHGKYFGIGGTMPPYSLEALSDPQLADVLAYLGL
jgi:thiosulfate dehydrogenase